MLILQVLLTPWLPSAVLVWLADYQLLSCLTEITSYARIGASNQRLSPN